MGTPALPERWGVRGEPRRKSAEEWSYYLCPYCGGRSERDGDRLVIFANPLRAWCRKCNWFEFADTEQFTKGELEPSKTVISRIQDDAVRHASVEKAREALYTSGAWLAAHLAVNEKDWAWALFENNLELRPLTRYLVERFSLGSITYEGRVGDERFSSPALSIPYFGTGRKLLTVQYRLLQPPDQRDRYRFERGLPATPFIVSEEKRADSCLVLEGAKKAMVLSLYLEENYDIIAVHGKRFGDDVPLFLKRRGYKEVRLALDPDAFFNENKNSKDQRSAVESAVAKLAEAGLTTRVVSLPDKPDDLIVRYGWSGDDIRSVVDMARIYRA